MRALLTRLARTTTAPHRVLAAAVSASAAAAAYAANPSACLSAPEGLTKLRTNDYTLASHYHGKARVRVLRVRREAGQQDTVQEYTVETRLFSPLYSRVFTEEDNTDLIATDTQKNTCYIVAKRTSATTPEGYGIDVARHLLREYPMLTAVEVSVKESMWRRHQTAEGGHDHGYIREAPECATAQVRLTREAMDAPKVVSGLSGLTVLKTTQSGFEAYHKDKYTLLPETKERCLATEMKVEWEHVSKKTLTPTTDFAAVRHALRTELMRGFFGPIHGGVYSASLQATIYDAGCLILKALPQVASVSIFTPNIHMIPFGQLNQMGSDFDDDVFVATSDPAGTIHCTVAR